MRIPLFAYPWRVSAVAGRKYRDGGAFWRLHVYGLVLREQCECDSVQDCVVTREGVYSVDGEVIDYVYPAGIDDDGVPYEAYDPRDDCEHRLRPPHKHSSIGTMLDAPIKPTGVLGVLREAAHR